MDTSYLAQQVTTIIGQLHGLFDEIGVPSHERDQREAELFSALSETLHNQLRVVTNEKHEMTEEARRLSKTIKQMEASLDDRKSNSAYDLDDSDSKITYPLTRCLQTLKEKYNTVSKLHRERFEQVKKLVEALESYASHLEPAFVQIKLPPISPNTPISPSFDISHSYITSLDREFSRVYDEYTRRVETVRVMSDEIIHLWAELGTPNAQTDAAILKYARDCPEQLGLHKDDLVNLRTKKDKLIEEKRGRERRLKELRGTIEDLWDRLSIEEHERRGFLAANRGCGMRTINEYEDELARLNELKRQNLHLFVEDARYKLQELWDSLYFSEEEMLDFTPAFSDVYSDALLSAHEAEIARLEALREQRLPTLEMIDRHRELVKEREDLQASSQDASRLMARGQKGEKRDPGKLLREEKMRKRIAKELPKVEAELRKTLENWENEYGRPFLVHGNRYLDELYAAASKSAPPRSKTPSVAPQAAPKSAKSAPPSRGNSVRGPPQSTARAKTPTANSFAMSVSRNPLPSSAAQAGTGGNKSPSRIPARAPLKNMPHGNNSPERQPRQERDESTIRKMGPPRAPPPKMKDLFMPPPPAPAATPAHPYSYNSDRSGSIVRHVQPEDVYDDRTYMSNAQMARTQQYHEHGYPPRAPPSRQISATSSASTANTAPGSENWETCSHDDESEDEYNYQRQQAARKRFTPDGGYASPRGGLGKKLRGNGVPQTMMEGEGGQLVRVEGSEAGWTDEDAF
ncbi:uncharacterized protein BDZ99DRAFT_389705 [Mytilinidion resinicola]|uniref:Microtubule associated protein n=1 Tax=Mytilinidion resinicola TaxID=574789 RepID=A0A6A6YL31_9PEZI|nr:uncharacterized protein BDZ99DRAFT_389705 [Mytilinidion resinicola]KAF2809238.1 hypothetical protein BDZ99DRAFT_389705 [Mytilinidion resinicola]